MRQLLKNAQMILPEKIEKGSVIVQDGVIADVTDNPDPSGAFDFVADLQGKYLSSGFIELHTHGAGGADFMDGTVQAYETACLTHLAHGTTTILPTLLAASQEEIRRSLDAFREARKSLKKFGLTLPGTHLEGPYLNPKQKGAINDKYIRDPDPQEYGALLAEYADEIARWTAAVELPGANEFGSRLSKLGILPSIGHSNAVYDQVCEAVKHGFSHVTHLFSAMSTITRRDGFRFSGVLESAFCIPELTVEVIADGCHLPAELLRMTYSVKGVDHVCLTCDCMRCAGQDISESFLGSSESGLRVIIEDGVAKLPDRSAFAGSVATDDRLVRYMYHNVGIPLYDAVRMMTLTPAKILKMDQTKGSIAPGKDADLVCFDNNIQILGVMAGGIGFMGELKKND